GAWYCTHTVNEGVFELPALSLAVQVTVVCPGAKVDPDAGEQVTPTGPSTSSIAVGAGQVTFAPAVLVAYAMIVSLGMFEITGAVWSTGIMIAKGDSEYVAPQILFSPG